MRRLSARWPDAGDWTFEQLKFHARLDDEDKRKAIADAALAARAAQYDKKDFESFMRSHA